MAKVGGGSLGDREAEGGRYTLIEISFRPTESSAARPLHVESAALPFAAPVMIDAQCSLDRDAWRVHLLRVVDLVKPDVIHTHHVALLSSILPERAGDIPVVAHWHATELR